MSTRPSVPEEVVLRAVKDKRGVSLWRDGYRFRKCGRIGSGGLLRHPMHPEDPMCWHHRHGYIYHGVAFHAGRDWWHPKKGRQGHGNSR